MLGKPAGSEQSTKAVWCQSEEQGIPVGPRRRRGRRGHCLPATCLVSYTHHDDASLPCYQAAMRHSGDCSIGEHFSFSTGYQSVYWPVLAIQGEAVFPLVARIVRAGMAEAPPPSRGILTNLKTGRKATERACDLRRKRTQDPGKRVLAIRGSLYML